IAPTLSRISLIAAQSQQYADRLKSLGARTDALWVTGSIKFDGVDTDRENPKTTALRQALGLQANQLIFIAGSTQEPEEELCLQAWLQLRKEFPNLRFVSVPRHKERFEDVAQVFLRHNVPFIRRSHLMDPESRLRPATTHAESGAELPAILLDTIGELSACWGLADIAFVGGSFGNRGGQNMIEPAAYGAAVLFGPNTSNFRDVVALFRANHACVQLSSPDQLLPTLHTLIQDRQQRKNFGQRAQNVVLSQQGATLQTVELLRSLIDDLNTSRQPSDGQIAA
ncbi:MAG: 3-deoxy-D-manno-octulosonic acid transferase, partial [Planctomycetaceae bacterium]|nr:3-deoxy-D-manno-octulosonic acid transferase [Planctomycetaceae bacterium]